MHFTFLHICFHSVQFSLALNVCMAANFLGGYCIRDRCEQTHAISYLEKVEEAIKWKTKGLIEKLKREWSN